MIKIILSGCKGKMGQVIGGIVNDTENAEIVCGFDINTEGSEYPVYSSPDEFSGDADAIIDFSHPSAFDKLTKYALRRNIPLIMCTTGLSSAQTDTLKELSHKIPVFFSANMSIGVNLMIELVQNAAKILYGNFDIEIIEKHHNQKIDAPSGTALAIADAINESIPFEAEYVYDRHAQRKKRGKSEIGIHAVRGGTIVGDHSVIFAGKDEVIEINHHASSKEVFAAGAVRAAMFMKGKPAGLYNMKNLVQSEVKL